jgi:hypothetical protein
MAERDCRLHPGQVVMGLSKSMRKGELTGLLVTLDMIFYRMKLAPAKAR